MTLPVVNLWMLDTVTGITLTLLGGCVAMRLCRQPAARKVAGAWTLLVCLGIGLATVIPGLPRIPLAVLPARAGSDVDIGMFRNDLPGNSSAGRSVAGQKFPMATAADSKIHFDFYFWTVAAYCAAAGFMAVRLGCGLYLARRLVKRSASPPSHVSHCWKRMTGSNPPAALRVSDTLPRPVTTGLLRLTVLVPRSLCEEECGAELEAVLWHELAHVYGRDTAILWLASLLRVFLFLHPLFWVLCRDLRMNQELLADAWAAGRIGSAAGYAERLIQVARTSRPIAFLVLPVLQAIRRQSELYQRMRYLLHSEHKTSLIVSRRVSIALAGVMLLMGGAGAVVTLRAAPRLPEVAGKLAVVLRPTSPAERGGVAFLLAAQEPGGGWLTQTGPGVTAMAVRALVQAGYAMDTLPVRRALSAIEAAHRPDGGYYADGLPTYNTAIVVGTLANLPGKAFDRQIAEGRDFLRSLESRPPVSSFYAAAPGRGSGASLVADQLPEWDALSDVWKGNAKQAQVVASSLFINSPGERTDEARVSLHGELTYVQLKSLLYAGLTRQDPRVRALVNSVRDDFTLAANPLYQTPHGQYYFYYVLSKTLRAYGEDLFVDARGAAHDWRAEMVARLAAQQETDGSWINRKSDFWLENNPILVTLYSVLALQESRR